MDILFLDLPGKPLWSWGAFAALSLGVTSAILASSVALSLWKTQSGGGPAGPSPAAPGAFAGGAAR
ncbi:hypothetical protein [Jannaschia formosa]|uniref:hypothetical protein n=1 Tax=Jannaschia formosa TaxID=2259592 RepID=UPI00142FE7A7|nr:hypothetical protein [Jannaschia formosa]